MLGVPVLFDVFLVLLLFLAVIRLFLLDCIPETDLLSSARQNIERKDRMGPQQHPERHTENDHTASRSRQRDDILPQFAVRIGKPGCLERNERHDSTGEIQGPRAGQDRRIDPAVYQMAEDDHDPLIDRKDRHDIHHQAAIGISLILFEHEENDKTVRNEQDHEHSGREAVTFQILEKFSARDPEPGMMPVDISRKGETTATFENIEPDLIYFPLEPEGRNKFEPVGYPFMINGDSGLHQFIPDTTKFVSAKLVRKMPVGFLMDRRQKVIDGFKVYVGKTESGPWTLLDSLSHEKSKTFHYIRNSSGIKEKYIRLVAPDSLTKELGEFVASSDSGGINALPLSIVGEPKDMSKRKKLIDGDVLSRFLYKPENGDMILKVDSKEDIGAMYLLARNDDNSVRPGDEYELFYFSRDGWKSLGKKTARGFELEYEVPDNSVLWLRDLTRGKEEQIFIIRNGRQLFNYDL